jgi:hypothetical protein
MTLQTYEIVERSKTNIADIPQLGDFKLQKSSLIVTQTLLENPNISLYCLDQENKNAIFVEIPLEIDLSQVPFVFMAQFEHASRVILAPYETFYQLAQQVPLEGHQLILIYSTGRSGTTVTSAAFNQAERVTSLSEPDVFSQPIAMRAWDGSNDQEVKKLLKACTHLICKNPKTKDQSQKWAIKFRSHGIEIGDLIYEHFPEAKSLFLYRNAEDWFDSMVRAFGGDDAITPEFLKGIWDFMKPVMRLTDSYTDEDLTFAQLGGVFWLNSMERYQSLADEGIPILPVRYEDIKRETLPVMEDIFKYCGVAVKNRGNLAKILKKDSQAGTVVARDITKKQQFLNRQEVIEELRDLLAVRPVINRTDYVFPGTLTLE